MTVLMASAVLVVGFVLVLVLATVGREGLVDRVRRTSRLVHQRHPARAEATRPRNESRQSSARCIITVTATLIAVPLGIAGAIYLNEYGAQRACSPGSCDSSPT